MRVFFRHHGLSNGVISSSAVISISNLVTLLPVYYFIVIKNIQTTFQINTAVHTGFPVTYEWDFNDGTSLLTETLGQVNHSFANVGRYNVTVRAHNELSQDIAWVSPLMYVYVLRIFSVGQVFNQKSKCSQVPYYRQSCPLWRVLLTPPYRVCK